MESSKGTAKERRQGTLPVTGLYLLAFLVVPNLLVILLGTMLYMVCPAWNIDYRLLAPAFAVAGPAVTAAGAALLLTLDLLQSILPGYQLSPQSALESASHLTGLRMGLAAAVALVGLTGVASAAWAAYQGLRRLPRRVTPRWRWWR